MGYLSAFISLFTDGLNEVGQQEQLFFNKKHKTSNDTAHGLNGEEKNVLQNIYNTQCLNLITPGKIIVSCFISLSCITPYFNSGMKRNKFWLKENGKKEVLEVASRAVLESFLSDVFTFFFCLKTKIRFISAGLLVYIGFVMNLKQ